MTSSALPLGFCSLSALDRPLGEVAELVAKLGLDGVEVTARAPHLAMGAADGDVAAAARAVAGAGVEVLAYGSYLGHPPHVGADHARREVEVAAALGTPLLRVWAETAAGDQGAIVAMLRAACDAAAPAGITVVVERHIGSYADTAERAEQLLDAASRPNLALNYQSLDFLPADATRAQPEDARRLAPRARYFHLKNYRPNPDGGPLLPGGSLAGGVLDCRAILAAAFEAGYAGPLSIEFVSFEPRPLEEKLGEDLAWLRGVLAELCP